MKQYDNSEEKQMPKVEEPAAHYADINTMKIRGVEMLMSINDARTLNLVIQDMKQLQEEEPYSDKVERMREFCEQHFTPEFAKEMEQRGYLINQPRPTNEHEFENLNTMFADVELEGDMSEQELQRMMAI